MTAVLRSELLKIGTTRGWWGYVGVAVLLTALGVAGTIGSAETDAERGTIDFQAGLVETATIAALIALLLGIVVVTVDFRHGTITPTFLATPVRERVVLAKAWAATLVSLALGLLAVAVVAAVALPWLAVLDVPVHVEGEVVRQTGHVLLAVVLYGLLGVAVGAAVQSQVVALVGTLLWPFVVELLLGGVLGLVDLDGVVRYLPFQALDAVDGGDNPEDILGFWPGLAVALAYVAAIGALGLWRTRRRDIT